MRQKEKKHKVNRAEQISKKNAKFKELSIGLYDIDSAIKYYWDNIIIPKVDYGDGEIVDVPLVYSSPERWKSTQKNGYIKDENGQIQTPIMVYQRTSMEKDDNMPVNKIDALNPQIFYPIKRKYSEKNRYSKFPNMLGTTNIDEYYCIVIPDYVKLTYECIIWTDFIEHLNKIIEIINYHKGSYWGNEKFKFRTDIDSFSTPIEISTGEDRIIKGTFSLVLNGYLIPDSYLKQMNNIRVYTKKINITESII